MVYEVGVAPVENGGFESEIGDKGGEIGGRAVGENGFESKSVAGMNAIAIEGMARGDDNRVGHERARKWASELSWWFLFDEGWKPVKGNLLPPVFASAHVFF